MSDYWPSIYLVRYSSSTEVRANGYYQDGETEAEDAWSTCWVGRLDSTGKVSARAAYKRWSDSQLKLTIPANSVYWR